MSRRKPKTATIWFRFKFADTDANRIRVQQAADRIFRLPAVIERRTHTEEEVVGMVKAALRIARCRGQMVFTRAELDAAMQDGAAVHVTGINGDILPRVKITWPESTGFLLDEEEN